MKIFARYKKSIQNQQGFVVLYASVISALLLLIAGGIFSLTVKETVLSSVARGSQIAFYAADSAMECALYRDRKSGTYMRTYITDLACDGSNHTITEIQQLLLGPTGQFGQYHAYIPFGANGEDGCAEIFAEYRDDLYSVSITSDTIIMVARGFNICDSSGQPITSDPRIVERRLRATFTAPTSFIP